MQDRNLPDLARATAKNLRIPARAARLVIDEFLGQVVEALDAGQAVRIGGFGRWDARFRRLGNPDFYRRQGVDLPEDGELHHRSVEFRFVRGLRRRLGGIVGSTPRRSDRSTGH